MQFFKAGTINVDFIGKRRLFMLISVIAILVGLGSLMVRGGLNYGIDFAGGTMVQVRFAKDVSPDDLRQSLAGVDLGDVSIQQFEDDEAHEFLIRVEKSKAGLVSLSDEIKVVLDEVFGSENVDIRRVEMVGPKVGKDLRRQGLLAIIYAMIGILIYVTVRFEFRFAARVAGFRDETTGLKIISLVFEFSRFCFMKSRLQKKSASLRRTNLI